MQAKDTDMVPNRDYVLWRDSCQRRASVLSRSDHDYTAEMNHTYQGRWKWGDYFAFSYVWGDTRENRQAVVNGKMHPVTDNLYQILQRLWLGRIPGLSAQRLDGCSVWVDAVCINQKDLQERNCQVKQMGTIYRHAFGTYAFLENGIGSLDMSEGYTVLQNFAGEARSGASTGRSIRQVFPSLKRMEPIAILSLGEVLCSTYWYRLWIIQETMMATFLVFICQDHAITYEDLMDGMLPLNSHTNEFLLNLGSARRDIGLDGDQRFWNRRLYHISRLQGMRHQRLYRLGKLGGYLYHHQLMQVSRHTKQKDDRDKIYGLLSLFDDDLQTALAPNYLRSVNQVYTDFAREATCYFKTIDFLRARGPTKNEISGLPSWVPDWRTESKERTDLISYKLDNPYRTTDNLQIEVEFSSDGVLSARGFLLDVCDSFGVDITNEVIAERIVVVQSTADHNIVYGSFENTREALWKTLTGDPGRSGETHSGYEVLLTMPEDEDEGWDLIPTVRDHPLLPLYQFLRTQNSHLRLGDRSFKEYFGCSGRQIPASEKTIRDAMGEVASCFAGRKLVVTAQGYLGLAPSLAKKGDSICILFGCSVPMIL